MTNSPSFTILMKGSTVADPKPAGDPAAGETLSSIGFSGRVAKGKGWQAVTISVTSSNRVRIAVRDTGHGSDPKVIERVEASEMPGNRWAALNVPPRVNAVRRRAAYSAP